MSYVGTTPGIFRVPQFGLSFPSEVMSRSMDLIDRSIWSGMKPVRLRRWMKNFTTDEENYFAGCILDALIYRSDEQTTALVVQLFQRSLVDLARNDVPPLGLVDDWLKLLRAGDRRVKLVAAVKRTDLTHKSAHLISRLMKRQLSIHPQSIAKPWELDQHIMSGTKMLVFVDDFLGTGQQFDELLEQEHLDWIFSKAYVVFAPFVAHTKGIAYLKKKYPQLRITATEVLDGRHELFNPVARAFDDGLNTADMAKQFYFDFLQKKGFSFPDGNREGFGGLGLTYVFEHAVPDNNLPLLWSPGTGDWMPLFDR
jgi:hypothetical protein